MKFEQSNIYYLRPEILEFAQAMDNEIAVQRQHDNEKCVNPQEAY